MEVSSGPVSFIPRSGEGLNSLRPFIITLTVLLAAALGCSSPTPDGRLGGTVEVVGSWSGERLAMMESGRASESREDYD